MVLLVLSASAFSFCLATIIMAPIGKRLDIKEKRLSVFVNKKKEVYNELDLSFYKRFIAPLIIKLSEYISKRSKNKNKKSKSVVLEKNLRLAGIRLPVDEYVFLKNVLTAPILLITVFAVMVISIDDILKFFIFLAGTVLWILSPRYYLAARITKRQTSIKYQLPEVLDLLCVSIEAGLGFDGALFKISEKMDGVLIDELMLLYREIQMGKGRRDALKDFAECSNLPEVRNFASAIIQADKLGIPIKRILTVQSEQLRTTRKQAAQEKGMKSPIKMMLPMVIFIFPVIFIILLGPIVIQLIEQFGA